MRSVGGSVGGSVGVVPGQKKETKKINEITEDLNRKKKRINTECLSVKFILLFMCCLDWICLVLSCSSTYLKIGRRE